MSIIISKESIHRLLRDVKHIIQNPLTDNGIYYKHDDEDMLKGYALIIGPEGTPYFGGNYFFEFKYPKDYPYSPPKVKFCTNGDDVRFNPNLYKCGKVCISILNTWTGDQWTSTQTISTVLLTLCSLFCENPFFNEPGVNNMHPDINNYNKIIEYANLNIALHGVILQCFDTEKLVTKNTSDNISISSSSSSVNNHSFLHFFRPIIIENFNKNIEKILEFTKKKQEEFPEPIVLLTNLYTMKVLINYNTVFRDLQHDKHLLFSGNDEK